LRHPILGIKHIFLSFWAER